MAKAEPHSNAQRLAVLNDKVLNASLRGAWQREAKAQKGEVRPWLWRWRDILPSLVEAGEIVPIDDFMRMRTVRLVNPSQPIAVGTARTFGVTIQHLNPGEVTESHRHTSASLYFVIEGNGTFTTAEGEQQFMEPGDLLIQPSWTWHGTQNTGKESALWLTSMDTPLNEFVEAYFREKYPEGTVQSVTKPDGYYMTRMGALRSREALEGNGPFPVKYRWEKTRQTLDALAAAGQADPYDGVILDYTNPLTGGPTTETLGCRIQMLRPGEETRSHRHTSNTIYHVVRGTGLARVGKNQGEEETLRWGERDCFIVPSWQWHQYRNDSSTESAILFSVSDRPLLQAIRLYREQD
ncbi:MAG TPA: cupin domain-containing protein [Candidatus Binatia bacterium]|nr:cupin domain-containing protein [Candidatus Binatia bacterium]